MTTQHEMQIGFIGLGNMGFPMMSRLVAAGHRVLAFDTQPDAVDQAVALGAVPATSVHDIGDRAETVLVSLPTPQVSTAVVTELADGSRVRRYVDFSTIGTHAAQHNCALLGARDIAALDSPVSGGVAGAQAGTLAVMVSGPRREFESVAAILEVLGRAIFVSDKPGAAQTMKLINNLMAATTLAATAEVMVMGVKAGLDAATMIDVLNAGSGGTHASRDKFPRAVLPRTFDYGFATGLMAKDVRLYLQEAEQLGLTAELAQAVGRIWETTLALEGAESDFTSVVKPLERSANVVIGTESR